RRASDADRQTAARRAGPRLGTHQRQGVPVQSLRTLAITLCAARRVWSNQTRRAASVLMTSWKVLDVRIWQELCEPTTHRLLFSDSASLSFCRLGPTAHRLH